MLSRPRSRKVAFGVGAILLFGAGAAFAGPLADERAVSKQILEGYLQSQPLQVHKWSQMRQSLLEIEAAQVNTTATTSFMFNYGVVDPIDICPSVGFAIPATYNLSNPIQTAGDGDDVGVNQLEPNGIYTGDSSGTYVQCVVGTKLNPSYWEGPVKTEVGVAHWDYDKKRVVREAKQGILSRGKR